MVYSLQRNVHRFTGLIEPARAGLKERTKDLETTLCEINHYKSILGTVRRFFGRIQERRIMNTLDVLPRIGQAIADDLEYRAERFYDLSMEQNAYVDQLTGHIGSLNNASLPEGFSEEEYASVIQRTCSKDRQERQEAFIALTKNFEAWSEHDVIKIMQGEGLDEYEMFRQEARNNLTGCKNVYSNLEFMAKLMQGRVDHLTNGLGMQREVIILGKDLLAVRQGLIEIAERGSEVYETAKESYGLMGDLMKELQSPRSRLLTSRMPSYAPSRTLHKVT